MKKISFLGIGVNVVRAPHKRSGGGSRSPLDGGQNEMSNWEGRRGVSKASGAGVIREHVSLCETGRPVINEPAPQCRNNETGASNKRIGAGLFSHQFGLGGSLMADRVEITVA
jgi:hypothetical protein